MNWIRERWQRLRFNRLDFDKRYVIDQVLSQTPRSDVLLARRRGGKRRTVMKLSDPGVGNALEVQCLRSLMHPGIAGYVGHGYTRDRRLWIETEYVDGVPLSAWLADRFEGDNPVETDRSDARDLILDLLSIVQYMHCCGWLHGDLSPQNIMVLSRSCRVVLVDFEHTRAIASPGDRVMPRRHSLEYASPHEIAGGATTESCEQYALGKLGLMMLGASDDSSANMLRAIMTRAAAERSEERYPNLHALVCDVQSSRSPLRSTTTLPAG